MTVTRSHPEHVRPAPDRDRATTTVRGTPAEQRGALPRAPGQEAPRGRPAAGTSVVALDVGARYITGTVMTGDGRVRESERWYTRPHRGPDAVLDTLLGCASDLAALAGRRGMPVVAAGLVVGGSVDRITGAATVPRLGWAGTPLRCWLEEHLDVPVALGHAGHAGAVAEGRLGAGRGCDAFVFVASGDPVLAAVLRGGRPAGSAAFVPDGDALDDRTVTLRSADSRALAELILSAEVERVVVGGPLPAADTALRQEIGSSLRRNHRRGPRPEVVVGRVGGRAACLGAAMLAQELAGSH
ncbi:ROK family protein [Streptomyces sp. BE20]|uniref:ROK family protein n=1 Tax=Streptomyces sp. BE20 TaxID=3002525 RepID=UPI002E7776CA|nr:ROK family protein [Streptomyces sp. BE20]MEE1824128.1 ROK family protein [Streptomyces sp. BE20]